MVSVLAMRAMLFVSSARLSRPVRLIVVLMTMHLMMRLTGHDRHDLEHSGVHVVEKVTMKGPITHIFRCDVH